MRSNDIRTFRIPDQRIGVPPSADDRFFQLLVRQRYAVDVDAFNFVGDGQHLRLVHDVINIGHTDIGPRPAAHLMHLIFQSGVADSSAYQRHVAEQCLGKPVTRTAHHPLNGGLIGTA
ncbi:hypothetical protein D3C75_770490 [compost metagenome]